MRKSDERYYKNAGKIGGKHEPAMPLTPQNYGGTKAMPMIPMAAAPKAPQATEVPPPFKRKGF